MRGAPRGFEPRGWRDRASGFFSGGMRSRFVDEIGRGFA